MTDEQVAELKKKHPGAKLVLLTHPQGGEVVVRSPSAFDYQKWKDRKADDAQRVNAGTLLFHDCAVWPEGPELAALTQRLPALPDRLAGELLEIAGAAERVEKKEL